MSELMQSLINNTNTQHEKALGLIHRSSGLLIEAETIAATLRSHGIADARADASTFIVMGEPSIAVRVTVGGDGIGEALLQALKDADLPIAYLEIGTYVGTLHLHAMDVAISVSGVAASDIAHRLKTCAYLLRREAA